MKKLNSSLCLPYSDVKILIAFVVTFQFFFKTRLTVQKQQPLKSSKSRLWQSCWWCCNLYILHLTNRLSNYILVLQVTHTIDLVYLRKTILNLRKLCSETFTQTFCERGFLYVIIPFSQSAFTGSKLTIETLEQGVKYVQS